MQWRRFSIGFFPNRSWKPSFFPKFTVNFECFVRKASPREPLDWPWQQKVTNYFWNSFFVSEKTSKNFSLSFYAKEFCKSRFFFLFQNYLSIWKLQLGHSHHLCLEVCWLFSYGKVEIHEIVDLDSVYPCKGSFISFCLQKKLEINFSTLLSFSSFL